MNKIRKNDEVVILAGKDRGKRGKVLAVTKDDKVVVSGINMVKKHTKPNPMLGTPGGIVEKEAAVHISNVALYNPDAQKGDRVGIKVLEDGKRVRIFKSTKEAVDN
ncbi:MAG: 50S ribosomal protein L24 [Hahellaceae bacterium]|nr:50S ribosomal protein L24 [Hahellaceae bacterium]